MKLYPVITITLFISVSQLLKLIKDPPKPPEPGRIRKTVDRIGKFATKHPIALFMFCVAIVMPFKVSLFPKKQMLEGQYRYEVLRKEREERAKKEKEHQK